jgi:hypothetical protein
VTHRLGFDVTDVNKAYQMYEQRLENVIKVVMNIGASNMAKTSLTSVGS